MQPQVGQPERIADELIKRIGSGGYPIGTKLPSERSLALEFEVSRPVIREALRMLAMLQLIEIQVGRGAYIRAAPDVADAASLGDIQELQDVIDVREVLEVGALVLAARAASDESRAEVAEALSSLEEAVGRGESTTKLDRRLHDAIIRASGSSTLLRIWRSIESSVARTIRVSPHGHVMSRELLTEHRLLALGVIAGEVDEAVAASRRLHEDNRRFLVELEEAQRDGSSSRGRKRSAT